jgi:hypothetical protein
MFSILNRHVFLITILMVVPVFAALLASAAATAAIGSECQELELRRELQENLNPASLLEAGYYVFEDGQPLPKSCLRKRVCQVNEFTRTHFGQSYYISLEERGGAEIERQFPDLVAAIAEGRGEDRMLYLNSFCRETEAQSDEGVPSNQ